MKKDRVKTAGGIGIGDQICLGDLSTGMSDEMMVIDDVRIVMVKGNVFDICYPIPESFHSDPFANPELLNKATIDFTREKVVGTPMLLPSGGRINVGLTQQAEKKIGFLVDCIVGLQDRVKVLDDRAIRAERATNASIKQVKVLENENHRLTQYQHNVENSSFWQRVCFALSALRWW